MGVYSEAGIEPENTGSGKGREVSGWARCCHDLRKGVVKVLAMQGKRGAGRGKRWLTLLWEGKGRGGHSQAVCRCS